MSTGYLVVKISDPPNKKNIGFKCVPASWTEKALRDNYSIIRYPEEENSKTREQVKNKEPPQKSWHCYCVLIMFRTDLYEKAIEFIAEMQGDTVADEQPDNTMNETKASASATPSKSGKRIQSEKTYNSTTNEDGPPKKKRESAIRSGDNLKMLIHNKLLHYNPKQKVSPKNVLSLQKEDRTETLKTLINAGQFNKLEKLYIKSLAGESHESTVFDDTIATDDSDSNNEPDTIPPPDRNILELAPMYKPDPTKTTINLERSKTALHEIVIATEDTESSHEPETIHPPERNILKPAPIAETNATNKTEILGKSKTALHDTVYSDPAQISRTSNLDQQKESNSNFKEIQSSLNAEVSSLQNRIHDLAPDNGTKHNNVVDIKHIEDIYNTILDVKSKMNVVYTEKSKQLKKAFESINLFVPELKKGLTLPTIEQLKENSQPNSDKHQTVSFRQKQASQRKGPSSNLRTPSRQQSEPSSDSEYLSQSSKPSTS